MNGVGGTVPNFEMSVGLTNRMGQVIVLKGRWAGLRFSVDDCQKVL